MNYTELRKQYHHFFYHDFHIEKNEEALKITYDFEIEGLSDFHPTFTLPCSKEQIQIADTALFKNAAFSLGMVELISYWKIACPKNVIVQCGSLNADQIAWWKKLYFHGLGEFFYINNIPLDPKGFMSLSSSGGLIEGEPYQFRGTGNLIPVGGGKDSFVTLDLLKEQKENNTAFIINPVISAVNSAHAAGYVEGKDLVIAKRTLDPNMLEMNKKGYLNGHTPFSAMAAFASYLTALVYGRKYITLSNEASANESTIKDSTVNHQYSKTYEFEQDFHHYCESYLDGDILYFSMLRPLSELQIAGLFSRLKPYHSVFRSCNVGSKKGEWCGHCAKCMFVYIMMSAYLSDEDVVGIFGKDMLNDETMREIFQQLSGIQDDKPFECVGTRDEVNIAICMSIARHKEEGMALPLLYEEYCDSSYYEAYKDKCVDMLSYQYPNLLPEEYETLLKKKLGESK